MGGMTHSSRKSHRPTLTTDADVTTMWQALISPLGWHNSRVYVILVDADRRMTSVVVEIDDIPDRFTERDAQALMQVYVHLLHEHEPRGSVAILVCRPGGPHLTAEDRTCCRSLYAAGRSAGVPMEVLHVGTDTAIVPVPLDEVLPCSA